MDKIYLDANDYLDDSFRLARQIFDGGWKPDVLLALWRGGAPVGVSVHEFLGYKGWKLRHCSVKCSSYTGIAAKESAVTFDCADEFFASLRPGEKVLVIDDIFDTGHTAAAVGERLGVLGIEFRFAAVYWKPSQNLTSLRPDYYVNAVDRWIVFPHEMDGLTEAELKEKNPLLHRLVTQE